MLVCIIKLECHFIKAICLTEVFKHGTNCKQIEDDHHYIFKCSVKERMDRYKGNWLEL